MNPNDELMKMPEFRGEKEIFKVNPEKKKFMSIVFGLILLGVVIFILFDILNIPEALEFLPGDKIWVSIVPLLVILLVIVVIYLDNINKFYVLTTKRVEIEQGIILKTEKSIANSHIQFVRYKQGYIDSLFNAGDVTINSASEGNFILFKSIESPKLRANQIQEQIRIYKTRVRSNQNL